jgi:hypothetical protein
MTAAEQIEQRTLAATQQPHRLRAIAESVNEGRPGWDVLSDLEVAGVLAELHRRGLVERIEMAYWQAIGRGRL